MGASIAPQPREPVMRLVLLLALLLAAGGPLISTDGSRVEARVIPTDEELMIARHSLAALRRATGGADR